MSWVAVGVAGASAVMGVMSAQEKQKTQKAQNIAAAEQTRNSPWTGMGAGQMQTSAPSTMGSGLQSGLGGYMAGRNIDQGFEDRKLAKAEERKKEQQEAIRKITEETEL